MCGLLKDTPLKVLALVGVFPNAFSFMPFHTQGTYSTPTPLRGSDSEEFRRDHLWSHSETSTISYEASPEPWQVVSLAEDHAFWLELQGEVFDGSVQIHELKRFDEFCANYRANPDRFSVNGHGQTVSPVGNFPGLRAQAIHSPFADAGSFPWAAALEANAAHIIKEYNAYVEGQSFRALRENLNQLQLITGYDKMSAAAAFPETSALIERWGLGRTPTGMVAFNCQAPGTQLQRPSDACNWLLSGHLGVSIPCSAASATRSGPSRQVNKRRPMCGLEVDGKRIVSEVGKIQVLDTSFRHCTWNNHPNESWVTFSFDFFHPDLSAQERRALTIFSKVFDTHVRRHERLRAANTAVLNRIFAAEMVPESVLHRHSHTAI